MTPINLQDFFHIDIRENNYFILINLTPSFTSPRVLMGCKGVGNEIVCFTQNAGASFKLESLSSEKLALYAKYSFPQNFLFSQALEALELSSGWLRTIDEAFAELKTPRVVVKDKQNNIVKIKVQEMPKYSRNKKVKKEEKIIAGDFDIY